MTAAPQPCPAPIKIAILAIGGQGGGVLADWLVDIAESAGWLAQATSVPGVAQRTGATLYYVELLAALPAGMAAPPLALMPTPGDVDLVIAAELMEGGRAIQRGLVTPERSTLIVSSHRSYAIGEKSAPGNGIADPNVVLQAGCDAAQRFICLDLQALAEQAGSVISASLLGAVAASRALPFAKTDFRAAIERGGLGVKASLRAFESAFEATEALPPSPLPLPLPSAVADAPPLPDALPDAPRWRAVQQRLRSDFPPALQPMLALGARRCAEFQDEAYAGLYLDRMARLHTLDVRHPDSRGQWRLSHEAARLLPVAMAYDDVIRVADLKTRPARFVRIEEELDLQSGQLLRLTDYLHPRLEEICGTLPARLGRWLENSPRLAALLRRRLERAHHIDSTGLRGFLMLYGLAGLRRWRLGSLRHQIETEAVQEWLDLIAATLQHDYDLAVEIVRCRRLVKGYSDTHARSTSKYRSALKAARELCGRPQAAAILRDLCDTALAHAPCAPLEESASRAGSGAA